MELPEIFLGLDLAQSADWTALCVMVRRAELPGQPYDVTFLQRWRNSPYTEVPARVRPIIRAARQAAVRSHFDATGDGRLTAADPLVSLVIDGTGVGSAVVDLVREANLDADLVPIVIHGGDAVNRADHGGWRTPKRDLVSVLQVLLQQRRLRIAESLPDAAVLVRELQNFRVKISVSGHDSYGAAGVGDLEWRERPHDDMVLAVALACWFAEKQAGTSGPVDPVLAAAFQAGGLPW